MYDTLTEATVEINGVRVSGFCLVEILNLITNPRPDRWYRFERTGDTVTVTVRTEPPVPEVPYDEAITSVFEDKEPR